MRKSRFSDHQILGILKQAEAGTSVPDPGPVPRARHQQRDVLQVAGEIWRDGRLADGTAQGA